MHNIKISMEKLKEDDNVRKKIEEELMYINNIEKQVEESIVKAPEGKLRCVTNKGYFQYYIGKKYLGKNKKEYAKQIAQKEYCLKMDKLLKKYRSALEEILNLYKKEELEDIYRDLYPARKVLVDPIIKPIEDIVKEFEEIQYEGKGFEEDDKTEYYTIKGERVRSKSEKIIADELNRYNIPYKYEMPLCLENWHKKIVVYPDFTVLNKRTGKKWIIEHLGMMDRSSYYENAMYKLDTYEKNNILLGESLLLFHETSNIPLNTNVVKKYIELYLI